MKFNIPEEHMNASGVYIIRNSVNEKVYVGSAVCFRNRYMVHKSEILSGKHHSSKLLRFCKKYGVDCLSFDLLEVVNKQRDALLACEQKWIDQYNACLKGMNSRPLASSNLGLKHTPRSISNMKRAKEENPVSEESRAKMRASQAARPAASLETRKRISEAKQGKPLTEQARGNIAKGVKSAYAKKGPFTRSPETIAKRTATRKARADTGIIVHKHTPEKTEQLRSAVVQYWAKVRNGELPPPRRGKRAD